MPAQKRSSADNFDQCLQLIKQEDVEQQEDDDEEQEQEQEQERERDQEDQEQEQEEEEEGEGEEEEESTNGSYKDDEDGSNNDEYVSVNLADMRKEVQCPICLGIIRKTRTVMECLHRFCRECIDKSMRMGNNECPACRTHCASRRSLRDDPNYDALIAALYQDIDKYEAEELAFRDEEKSRNKQIQASIAQTFRRQTEALGKKRTTAKAVAAFMKRSRGRRGRSSRNSRAAELQGSDDEEDGNGNEGGRDSSSADERSAEIKSKRCKRWSGPRFSQPSSAVDADGGCDGNDDFEVNRESTVASPGLLGSPEVLAWGRGGVRSHTRYGSVSGNGKNGRNRIAKLVDYLRSTEENLDKLDIHLIVVPLDEQSVPSLEEPFLCCRPTLTVGYLNQFVALQTQLQAEEVEILVVKEPRFSPSSDESIPNLDPNKDKLQLVEEQETLGELLASCNFSGGHLVLAYRQKVSR